MVTRMFFKGKKAESEYGGEGHQKGFGQVDNVSENSPLALVSMYRVAERIQLKDLDAAKRWCEANEIQVHKFGKKQFVYQFDLEYNLGKPFVMALMKKHPEEWKIILQDVVGWDALYNYFLLNFNQQDDSQAANAAATLDREQTRLLKRLLK